MSEPIDELMYRMDNTPRGTAVIINNKTFLPSSGMHRYPRKGTDLDRDALKKTFKDLLFKVEVFNNKTVKETQEIFKNLATKDYSSDNALVVCVLSHGEEGIIYATDGTIQIKDMIKCVKGSNLAGKPKLFIFQACQGEYIFINMCCCDRLITLGK
jgi:hypothetical protein